MRGACRLTGHRAPSRRCSPRRCSPAAGRCSPGCAAGEARREGGTGAVSDDALSRAEENGWEAVDEFTDEPAEAATDAADTTAPFGRRTGRDGRIPP